MTQIAQIENYLKEKLNEEQYKAACFVTGHSLILAGAGSGKTRTLTYKIANLITAHSVKPARILAVTFTNKAANEMKERLLSILEDLNSSYKPRDFMWTGTFHSIFLKILKQDIEALQMNYTTGFTVYDTTDSSILLKKIIKDKNMSDRIEFREVKRYISIWKNKGRLPEQAGLHCDSQSEERASIVYKEYQKNLEDSNALDFDDLLLLSKILFDTAPQVVTKWQEQFLHILVDEAQDTNTIQFELMKKLVSPAATITFIGDDYQSIYRWRGAVMDNFLNLKQRWPEMETFKLETNYRSKPHIVAAGNAIIQKNNKQYEKELVAFRSGDDFIRIFAFADEIDEAQQIIELITKVKEEHNKPRSDFTILYRTNAQSSPFEQILLTEGIPYSVVGAFKFFERVEIKDMISYIKYLLNPRDTIALQRIINTPNRKIGKTSIEQLEQAAQQHGVSFPDIIQDVRKYGSGIAPAVQNKIVQFSNIVQSLLGLVSMLTPGQLLEQIVQGTRYEEYLIKSDGKEKAEERMENIGQLINIAYKYQEVGIESITSFLEEISLMTSLEDSAEESPDMVRLMSVHASKGLEFPYVFIVGVEEGVFPLPKAKFDDDELEEERRGMYVALTRAEDHLFLSYAHSRQQRGQVKYNPPSRFLEELPEEIVKRYDMAKASASRNNEPTFEEGDRVSHKLFGSGEVLENWGNVAIVKFHNPKFGIRKMESKRLKAE